MPHIPVTASSIPMSWNDWLQRGWHGTTVKDWIEGYLLAKLDADLAFLGQLREQQPSFARMIQRMEREVVGDLARKQYHLPWGKDKAQENQFLVAIVPGQKPTEREHALPVSQVKSLVLMARRGTDGVSMAKKLFRFAWVLPTVLCSKETHKALPKTCDDFNLPYLRYSRIEGLKLIRFDGKEINPNSYTRDELLADLAVFPQLHPILEQVEGMTLPSNEEEAQFTREMTRRIEAAVDPDSAYVTAYRRDADRSSNLPGLTESLARQVNECDSDYARTDQTLNCHKEELRRALKAVLVDSSTNPGYRTYPPRCADSLLADLAGKPIDNEGPGYYIRKSHDFYGWKATSGSRGHCAGALYRTEGFLRIPLDSRNGSKGPGRTIHIEHTVPVNVLAGALQFKHGSCRFDDAIALHRFLIQRSICVAFSAEEEASLGSGKANVPPRENDAFGQNGEQKHCFPFRRYLPLRHYLRAKGDDFRVFNVVTGQEVSLENFTFADHEATLRLASELVLDPGGSSSVFDLELFRQE